MGRLCAIIIYFIHCREGIASMDRRLTRLKSAARASPTSPAHPEGFNGNLFTTKVSLHVNRRWFDLENDPTTIPGHGRQDDDGDDDYYLTPNDDKLGSLNARSQ